MADTLVVGDHEELKEGHREVGKRHVLTYTADGSSPGTITNTIIVEGQLARIYQVYGGTKPDANMTVKIYHPKRPSSGTLTDLLDGNGTVGGVTNADDVTFEGGANGADYTFYGEIQVEVSGNAAVSASSTIYIEFLRVLEA